MSDNRTLYKFASTDKFSMRPSVNNMNREMLINEVLEYRRVNKPTAISSVENDDISRKRAIERQKPNWLGYIAIFILGYCVAMMVATVNNVKYQEQHHCTPINIDRG